MAKPFYLFYDCETSSGNLNAAIIEIAIKCDPNVYNTRCFHSFVNKGGAFLVQ